MEITCTLCEKPLTGKIDTYGDYDQPFCFDCWGIVNDDGPQDFYGVGPHIHDLKRTGNYIGSTVRLELPEPDKYGWRDLKSLGGWYAHWMYREDPDAPGCGTYVHKSNFEPTEHGRLLDALDDVVPALAD